MLLPAFKPIAVIGEKTRLDGSDRKYQRADREKFFYGLFNIYRCHGRYG